MGLFSTISKAIGLGGTPDLNSISTQAFNRERQRLLELRVQKRKDSNFITTEGKGIAQQADFQFGNQTGLQDLTQAERDQRATGRIDTKLIL